MSERRPDGKQTGYEWGYEEHRRRQARSGLSLTPAERLRWLERTMEELARILGRARDARPFNPRRSS
jgi:hypothetical protein